MASGSQVKAGGAFVEISADSNPLVKGLNSAGAQLKQFGDKVSSIGKQFSLMGAAITAPLAAMVTLSTNAGAAIYDMSRRTGASVEALSRLGFAANMTGTDMETVETGIKRMQKSIAGVKDEFEGTTGSLSHLGIALEDIKNLSPDQQFALIASKISEMQDPAARTAAAMSVFGRSGTMLIPMLEQLNELSGKADAFGLVRSAESAKNAKEYTMTMTLLSSAVKSVNSAVTSALLPTFKQKAELLARITFGIRNIIKENPAFVQGFFKMGAALTVAGVALYGFGKYMTFAGAGLKTIAGLLALVASPLGLIAAGLAGVAVYAVYAGSGFENMAKIAKDAISGIGDALMAGDIQLASQIVWASLKLGWTVLKNDLIALFDQIINAFTSGWIEAIAKVQVMWAKLKNAFNQLTTNIGDSFVKTELQVALKGAKSELRSREKNPEAYNPDTNEAEKAKLRKTITEREADLKALDQIHQVNLNNIDAETQAKLDAIEKERKARIDALKSMNSADDKERIEAYKKEIDKLTADLAALKAKAAAEHHDAPPLPTPPTAPVPSPGDLNVPGAGRAAFSSGTFNPNAIFGLGAGISVQERTAKAAERMEAQVQIIARKLWGASVAAGTAGIGWL